MVTAAWRKRLLFIPVRTTVFCKGHIYMCTAEGMRRDERHDGQLEGSNSGNQAPTLRTKTH